MDSNYKEDMQKKLTARQKKVLKYIALNLTSKQIAEEMNIKEKTVSNHRANICKVLGIKGANALLHYATKRYRKKSKDRKGIENSADFYFNMNKEDSIFIGSKKSHGIAAINHEYKIVSANETLESWFPFLLEGSHKKCYELLQAKKKPCGFCPLRELNSRKLVAIYKIETNFNNEKRTLETFAFPVCDHDDELLGVVEHIRNITIKPENSEG
ncbi:MAG: PAS domain-containing protein [Nitrospinae bacterium]|nr:PAS domain-containing protein [Nitrospinota bacterium]